MKDRPGAILRPEQERYVTRLLPPRDALLSEMEAAAREEGVPISDPEVAQLLATLAVARQARRVLEVGTAIGYGALWLARAMPDVEVVTIDLDPEQLERARGYLERAGVAERVELVEGAALEVLPGLEGPFDLVYLDAVKSEYRRYLDLVVPLLAMGGVVVVDNVLWKGRVAELADDPEEEDEETRAMRTFNPYFVIHPQLESLVLPVGDGVALGAKKRPTVREMGGPF